MSKFHHLAILRSYFVVNKFHTQKNFFKNCSPFNCLNLRIRNETTISRRSFRYQVARDKYAIIIAEKKMKIWKIEKNSRQPRTIHRQPWIKTNVTRFRSNLLFRQKIQRASS